MNATRHRAPPLRTLLLATLLPVALAACGGAGGVVAYETGVVVPPPPPPPVVLFGSVEVDNLSFEFVDTFFLAPAATDLWTENLFFGPLPPAALVYVGDFVEDVYDAEADLELGDLVQWFDVPVPGEDVTTFEVY